MTVREPAASWVAVDDGSDFPLANLPYGVFARAGEAPRVGVAIGAQILDMALAATEGLLDEAIEHAPAVFGAGSLNAFMARGPGAWQAVRRRLTQLLAAGDRTLRDLGLAERALVDQAAVALQRPFAVGDFVDFYSSRHHAENLGRLFRPGGEPLLPNWRHLPVGYHGRAGTVVASGTPITRPWGQTPPPAVAASPGFGPSAKLDFELEVGFVIGPPTDLGERVGVERAEERIFGVVLVNDWSARDIQAWEYQPLGPFLGKSFATSISPWVVPMEALAPYRCEPLPQDPQPLPYLRDGGGSIDLQLEVELRTEAMRQAGDEPQTIARCRYRDLYWTPAQQLAHATVNGAALRTGDLFASGTISGEDAAAADPAAGPPALGTMIELTLNGQRPLTLPGGEQRTFLADGDEVRLRGWCGGNGRPRIGFGEVTGMVHPAATL